MQNYFRFCCVLCFTPDGSFVFITYKKNDSWAYFSWLASDSLIQGALRSAV